MFRLKQLSKDYLIYGIGSILAKGVSFLLLPIYTRIFTPADYGTIEMLNVIGNLVATILAMGTDAAQSMYFFKYKKKGFDTQARIVSAILQLRILWGTFVVILATFFGPLFNLYIFNGKLSWEYFAFTFTGVLLAQIMSQSAEVMRLLFRPLTFIGIIFVQSALSVATILTAVVIFDQGILGFISGTAIASTLAALFGWYHARKFISFKKIHFDWWPIIIKFGAPLVPVGFGMYLMNAADRWFIQYYWGDNELGIFAAGAKLALLITLIVETFRQAWWPIALDAMHSDDGEETFRKISNIYISLACSGMIVLTYASPSLAEILFDKRYHESWRIVGVIGWHSVFYGFFMIGAAGIWKSEKSFYNLPIMLFSTAAGLLANFILVPSQGGIGAAAATVISNGVWITISYLLSQRYWNIRLPILFGTLSLIISWIYIWWFINFGFEQKITAFLLALIICCMIVVTAARRIRFFK